ncbi:radical SAM protein [Azotobacter armeniacus]
MDCRHQPTHWKPSKYNWILPIDALGGGGAIYNAYTGACLDFGENDFKRIKALLNSMHDTIDFHLLGDSAIPLGGALIAGGMVVEYDFDELADLEERINSKKIDEFPLVLTITPTFSCNLGCNYCFVGKKKGLMNRETEHEVISFVKSHLESGNIPAFSVDWFGGEPLLAKRSIGRLSSTFIELCAEKAIPYRAQLITNGTLLNAETAGQLESWGIDRIQITLDGKRSTHDTRRPWKGLSHDIIAKSSFDDTLSGIEHVIGRVAIRLRINVDRNNLEEAFSLLHMFDQRDWLSPDLQFYPYLSMITDFTDAATGKWSLSEACFPDEFYRAYQKWLDLLNARGISVAGERLYGFPQPITTACGAFSERGWIINFDGQLHKCGLDSDTDNRSIGFLGKEKDQSNSNALYWSNYNPATNSECRQCRAFPVCLGGCARDRRDNRYKAMLDNCEFHRKYEPLIIAQHIRMRRENNLKARIGSEKTNQ